MNITDVGHLVGDSDEGEDKLEVGARREGSNPLEIAKKYANQFFDDLAKLNIEIPEKVKTATETIESQIEIIKLLFEKDFAYKTKAAIYFDTSKVRDYGKLTGQSRQEMQAGARSEVVVDPEKRNPQDFALWFFLVGRYKSHVLHWPSLWGEGFPGWHIECSAISRELLGQPFDIHTGGVDHIGTHHTNEIAQSEAAFNKPLANYWLHNEFLMVDGKKMAKSEGNLYTLKELQEKGFSPLDFRYLCLMAHYHSKMNFTWEALERAKETLMGIRRLIYTKLMDDQGNAKNTIEKTYKLLNDDLDIPKALAILHDSKSPSAWIKSDIWLGLSLSKIDRGQIMSEKASQLFQTYKVLRKDKKYDQSDKVREELRQMGYEIQDEKENSRIARYG
jgi:cysteinyl-tRNA synthetase